MARIGTIDFRYECEVCDDGSVVVSLHTGKDRLCTLDRVTAESLKEAGIPASGFESYLRSQLAKPESQPDEA